MADPLSISASIIAILQLTGTVVQYLNDAKGASEDRQRIIAEISSSSGALFLLKDLAERVQCEEGWSMTIKSLNLPGGPLEKFRVILQQLASKLQPGTGAKRIGKALIWPFQKGDINEMLRTMEHQKTLFNLALQNDHIGLSRCIRNDVASLHDKVDEVNQRLAQVKINQTGQESHLQDQDFRQILTWLSPLDFPVQHSDLISQRQEGTGEWVFASSQFKTWLNGTRETLFCPGIPGAGKTILASIVIDHLSKVFQAEDVGVAYMYCTYRNRLEQTPMRLLASLLKQLLQERRFLPEDLKSLYKHHTDKDTLPTLDEISNILQSEMSKYSRVFIVVDALDECNANDSTRERLLFKINTLQATNAVNLMVTSRPILTIEQKFRNSIKLEIRASDLDLQKYVEGHMARLSSCVLKNTSLQEAIKSSIVKAADGMFLLAQLHLDSLAGKTSPKAIRKALETLPKGSGALSKAYDEVMERINSQKPDLPHLAMQVLSWTTYAARPLSALELRHALAVEPGESEMDEENLSDIEELVSICAGLVIVDQESNIVRLVHYTTQEYLERALLEHYPNAQRDITITCLTYVLFDPFKEISPLNGTEWVKREFDIALKQYPFVDYAAQHWSHYPDEFRNESVQGLALSFLINDSDDVVASNRTLVNTAGRYYSLYSGQQPPSLHLVALLGIKILAQLLLDKGEKLDSRDSYGWTPLSWASRNGHEEIVVLLLDRGAELDSKDNYGQTPLSKAAEGGHETVAGLLLDKGAELESRSKLGQTPLSRAAGRGNETVVGLLLDKGAELESRNKLGQTPLSRAASQGHETIVRLLLDKGAELESRNEFGRTPLSFAVERGHETMVALLLDKGAELESADRFGQTPLSFAAERGYETMVALLLDKGAQLESADRFGQTPLSFAVERGYETMVALLLDKGAELESADRFGQTPLSLAAKYGHEEAVVLLLEKGAMSNNIDSIGKTPLSWAAERGHRAVAAVLQSALTAQSLE